MKAEEFKSKYGKRKSLQKETAQSINKRMTESFLRQCAEAGFPKPLCEFRFHPDRKWRIDFCMVYKDSTIGVEIEGLHGRHQSIGGFLNDMEKYREITIAGIRLLRFTVKEVFDGTAIREIKRLLSLKKIDMERLSNLF